MKYIEELDKTIINNPFRNIHDKIINQNKKSLLRRFIAEYIENSLSKQAENNKNIKFRVKTENLNFEIKEKIPSISETRKKNLLKKFYLNSDSKLNKVKKNEKKINISDNEIVNKIQGDKMKKHPVIKSSISLSKMKFKLLDRDTIINFEENPLNFIIPQKIHKDHKLHPYIKRILQKGDKEIKTNLIIKREKDILYQKDENTVIRNNCIVRFVPDNQIEKKIKNFESISPQHFNKGFFDISKKKYKISRKRLTFNSAKY